MSELYNRLSKDIRFIEGLNACINCGTCTAICPAAAFYKYDPRQIVDSVQTQDEKEIESLLSSDTIWYCGECMSCKTRCPRENTPGLIIMALREISVESGLFAASEKGRQQLALKRTVGDWILNHGYCLYLDGIGTDLHPEQGPVWDWIQKNWRELFARLGANYQGEGDGVLRKIPQDTLDEIKSIFEITGGMERYNTIERVSKAKAFEMGLEAEPLAGVDYFMHVYTANNEKHYRTPDDE